MTELGTLGGNNSSAFDINNRGQAVGGAENTTPDSTCTTHQFQYKPVIWEKGEIQELPTFPGDPDGFISAINNHGQAAGAFRGLRPRDPGIYRSGARIDLRTGEKREMPAFSNRSMS